MFRAVDCLGFAGGFTLGMVQAGFELVGKRELPGGFGVANCEANRDLLGYDWEAQSIDPAQWGVVNADVVFGNPPCSGFSAMSNKHFRGANSKINHCMWSFVDYAARVNPQVAVFESVQLAFTRLDGHELMRQLRSYLEEKTSERWTLFHVLHNAYAVGGSAQRRRYFWVAARIPFGIESPSPGILPLLRDVIGDLADLEEPRWEPQSYPTTTQPSHWATSRRSPANQVDGHAAVRNPLTQRIRDLLEAVDWRPGEHLAQVTRRYYDRFGRLPSSWAATEEKVIKNDFKLGYTTPIRWNADQPARVITGGSLFTVVHPWLLRTITQREAARIMGFPDNWLLEPLRNQSGLSATHGKGITVDCGRWIGGWIRRALLGGSEVGTYRGISIGDREFLLDITNCPRESMIQSTASANKKLRKRHQLRDREAIKMNDESTPVTEAITENTNTEEANAAENVATTDSGKKGRPRPQATIDRDNSALTILEAEPEGLTKEELAGKMGVEIGAAYLSIYRLNRDGRVHKTRNGKGGYVWKAGSAPASAEDTAATTSESDVAVAPESPVEETVAL